jgi:hypothetical protein
MEARQRPRLRKGEETQAQRANGGGGNGAGQAEYTTRQRQQAAKQLVAACQKEAKNRMAKMLDNAKSRLRNDSAERTRVEKTMSQMNVTPSEQQSMEIAASALAMEALYKDGSSKGVWNGGINKNMAASVKALVQQCR